MVLGKSDRPRFVKMMSCRADLKKFDMEEKLVDTERSARLTFELEQELQLRLCHVSLVLRDCSVGVL